MEVGLDAGEGAEGFGEAVGLVLGYGVVAAGVALAVWGHGGGWGGEVC